MPEPRDVLNHFNKNNYPKIQSKYEKILNPIRNMLLSILGKKPKDKDEIYKEWGIESSKDMFEFVIGNNTNDIARIKLLLEVIRLEMDRAYGNVYLDYIHCADMYMNQKEDIKANIIKKCLDILSKRFRDSVAILTITENHIIIETSTSKTLVHKDDFLKNTND